MPRKTKAKSNSDAIQLIPESPEGKEGKMEDPAFIEGQLSQPVPYHPPFPGQFFKIAPPENDKPLPEEVEVDSKPQHYYGHRKRLRDRLLNSGPESMQDYELIEMLLFPAIPRRDVKPLAKELLSSFGSVWNVVNAPQARLRNQFKLGDGAIASFALAKAVNLHMAKKNILKKPILGSWDAVIDYCQAAMNPLQNEQMRLLFLDRKNVLISEEVHQNGTIDQTPVYPREVVKRGLELGATAIIITHNHPSGDPNPSQSDIELTRQVKAAAEAVGLKIHDHIVIGKEGRFVSFRNMGLI